MIYFILAVFPLTCFSFIFVKECLKNKRNNVKYSTKDKAVIGFFSIFIFTNILDMLVGYLYLNNGTSGNNVLYLNGVKASADIFSPSFPWSMFILQPILIFIYLFIIWLNIKKVNEQPKVNSKYNRFSQIDEIYYCAECSHLTNKSKCTFCGNKKTFPPSVNDYCFLTEVNNYYGEVIMEALTDNNIKFIHRKATENGIVVLTGSLFENTSIYVPFSQLKDATKVMTILQEDIDDIVEE